MTFKERLLMAGIMLLFIVPGFVVKSCEAAEDIKYHITAMPVSWHHADRDGTNERHNGIGINARFDNRVSLGAMWYKNSYNDTGPLYSVSYEFLDDCTLCPGIGGGYAPEYDKSDNSTVLGWVSLRYGWVTVLTVPTQVTTMILAFPIN